MIIAPAVMGRRRVRQGSVGGGSSEAPVYVAGVSTLLHAGNSSDPDYVDLATSGGFTSEARFVPADSQNVNGGTPNAAQNSIITGKDGVGLALRCHYRASTADPQDQPSAEWYLARQGTVAATRTICARMMVRITGTLGGDGNHTKWVHIIRAGLGGASVPQYSSHGDAPFTSSTGKKTFWQAYSDSWSDNSGDNPGAGDDQATQKRGPYFEDLINTGWHEFVYEDRPHSAAGVYDGCMRMFIDGVKILDLSAAAVDVPVPGGEGVWCKLPQVQHMIVGNALDQFLGFFFGGTQTSRNTPAWDYDVNLGDGDPENPDTFVMWATPT